jgi:hypothetical protein
VHTTTLRSDAFVLTIDGRPAAMPDLFPGFDEHDRLGIVIGADHGAAGAGTLVLAAVTAFYDRLRATREEFFAYADYFAFHVGHDRGSLRKLDVYPEHKEVVVTPDPEEILRAINDRGVTRLLVPDIAPAPHVTSEPRIASEPPAAAAAATALNPDTRDSAERRLRTALAYSPNGDTSGADVVVRGSSQSDSYIHAMLATTGGSPEAAPGTQSFRRLEIPTALGMLAAAPG